MAKKAALSPKCAVPESILASDSQSKKNYFKTEGIVTHPRLTEVSEALDLALASDANQIILIPGATGVGKSMVHHRKYEKLEAHYAATLEENCPEIPVLYEEVRSPRSKKFEWGAFARSILIQCVDIGMTRRNLMLSDSSKFPIKEVQKVLARKNSEQELMSAMEEAIESRQVRYLFVDEAHHFLLSCRDEYLMNLYMETLKSISNKGEVKLVLDGNYELLRFLEGSGQLARRTKVINFSPYLASSSSDIEAFEEAFLSLFAFYPAKLSDGVLGRLGNLFVGSCGCVGILKQWMERALNRALNDSRDYVSWEDFEVERLEPMALKRIARDIRAGEDLINSVSMDEVWSILMGGSEGKSKQGSRKPGERRPGRDKVA